MVVNDQPAPGRRTYPAKDRPEVTVEVDGNWYDGDLYAWNERADGWWAMVRWTGPDGNRLDHFPAVRVHRVDYCPWFRGYSECRFECERGSR